MSAVRWVSRWTIAGLASALLAATLASPAGALPKHVRFEYTGAEQEYKVPANVTMLSFIAQGGWGGISGGPGESGASIGGFLPSSPGQTLYVEVGANGEYGSTASDFGGGAPGGTPPPDNCIDLNHGGPCGGSLASSGGGASDLRAVSDIEAGSLASRVVVAAGAGGTGGGGNGSGGIVCGKTGGAGSAQNPQPLPEGNAEDGPLPIKVTGGLVIPGLYSKSHHSRTSENGVLDAGPGTNAGGVPGEGSSCTAGEVTAFDSLPGLEGSDGLGGGGGNAAGLPPFEGTCKASENTCANAGAGGGGGGGYFGGGGGATGYDRCSQPKVECDSASGGEGGAGGSSFVANSVIYPKMDQVGPAGTGVTLVTLVPMIEISSPASGANYPPGQVVKAAWECSGENADFAPAIENCSGTKANGEVIDTSKGAHTFTVTGVTRFLGAPVKPVTSTITYTALGAPTVTKVKPARGPVAGGTTVTITGTDFEDVTDVSFGGRPAASFHALSPTSIAAVAPASSPGKVTLTVTSAGGTSAVTPKGDKYKFTPTVGAFEPAGGPAAGGTLVTVSGTGFSTAPGATTVEFGKTKATDVNCASATTCTATAPVGVAGAVPVRVVVAKATSPKSLPGDLYTYR